MEIIVGLFLGTLALMSGVLIWILIKSKWKKK